MTTNRFRTRIAVGAIGAAIAMSVAAGPEAFADQSWGAIAISPDGSRWAVSAGEPDASSAKNVAVYRCMGRGAGCNSNVTTFTDCAVLVRDGQGLFTATGATKEDAESAAQAQHPGNTPVSWGCNNPTETGPSSYRG